MHAWPRCPDCEAIAKGLRRRHRLQPKLTTFHLLPSIKPPFLNHRLSQLASLLIVSLCCCLPSVSVSFATRVLVPSRALGFVIWFFSLFEPLHIYLFSLVLILCVYLQHQVHLCRSSACLHSFPASHYGVQGSRLPGPHIRAPLYLPRHPTRPPIAGAADSRLRPGPG